MNRAAAISLLVNPADSAIGEAVHRGLRAAGLPAVVVPTVFDAVVESERAGGALRHIILGVDHCGREEFRLFPLVRREWPETILVAYHSPGFAYKGRLAELVGADIVLSNLEDVSEFVEGLATPAEPPAPLPVETAAQPPRAAEPKPTAAPAPAAVQYLARAPAPPPRPEPPPREVVPAAAAISRLPVNNDGFHAGGAVSTPSDLAAAIAEDPVPVDEASPSSGPADVPRAPMPAASATAVAAAPSPEPAAAQAATPAPAPPMDEQEMFAGDAIGTIELTEEELHLLLGEEEET